MPKFMLILHTRPNNFRDASPEEIQQIVEKYNAWRENLIKTGRFVVSDKLLDEGGKVMTSSGGHVSIVDGPYSEAREVVGGYFTLKAASYEEVIELTRDCPHLSYGGRIELRQIDPMGCGGE